MGSRFLSTLSLRRATVCVRGRKQGGRGFLSTLSLRRATTVTARIIDPTYDFYPRSPCGERPAHFASQIHSVGISIHALLAESDVNKIPYQRKIDQKNFYPRSPCGERLMNRIRRAIVLHFYPRSPCGERPPRGGFCYLDNIISIHALLAESDFGRITSVSSGLNFYPRSPCGERQRNPSKLAKTSYFYPRSPCGERPFL